MNTTEMTNLIKQLISLKKDNPDIHYVNIQFNLTRNTTNELTMSPSINIGWFK